MRRQGVHSSHLVAPLLGVVLLPTFSRFLELPTLLRWLPWEDQEFAGKRRDSSPPGHHIYGDTLRYGQTQKKETHPPASIIERAFSRSRAALRDGDKDSIAPNIVAVSSSWLF